MSRSMIEPTLLEYDWIDDFENYDKISITRLDRDIQIYIPVSQRVYMDGIQDYTIYLDACKDFPRGILEHLVQKKSVQSQGQALIYINSFIDGYRFRQDIRRTFANPEFIKDQFFRDIARSQVYIQSKRVDHDIKAFHYLEYTYQDTLYDNMALCTQAVMGFLFEWIQLSLPEGYFLGDLHHTKSTDNSTHEYWGRNFCVDTGRSMKIHIRNNTLFVEKQLHIFQVGELEAITCAKVCIEIEVPDLDQTSDISVHIVMVPIHHVIACA